MRVWVPGPQMQRLQATMAREGPRAEFLTVAVRSDFREQSVPLQVCPALSPLEAAPLL